MLTSSQILSSAKETLEMEAASISGAINHLNEEFAEAVETIIQSNGRIIITGIGKSANVANKIVATLNSTGSPAVFMHAADAIHGDLGIIQEGDVVIAISNSGNTPEIKHLLPLLKQAGFKLLAFTGNKESALWKAADFRLYTGVEKEACPNNLAPTSSTTVQMAMGDALAVALLKYKGFKKEDYAKYHPGGALGKQLYLRVDDVLVHSDDLVVNKGDNIKQVIFNISANRMGAVVVCENDAVQGVITDGDIRRMLERFEDIQGLTANQIMTANPISVEKGTMAKEAAEVIKSKNISQLIVTNEKGGFEGLVHFHDLLKEGIL